LRQHLFNTSTRQLEAYKTSLINYLVSVYQTKHNYVNPKTDNWFWTSPTLSYSSVSASCHHLLTNFIS